MKSKRSCLAIIVLFMACHYIDPASCIRQTIRRRTGHVQVNDFQAQAGQINNFGGGFQANNFARSRTINTMKKPEDVSFATNSFGNIQNNNFGPEGSQVNNFPHSSNLDSSLTPPSHQDTNVEASSDDVAIICIAQPATPKSLPASKPEAATRESTGPKKPTGDDGEVVVSNVPNQQDLMTTKDTRVDNPGQPDLTIPTATNIDGTDVEQGEQNKTDAQGGIQVNNFGANEINHFGGSQLNDIESVHPSPISNAPINTFGNIKNNNYGGGAQRNHFERRGKRSASGVQNNNMNGIQPNNHRGHQNNQWGGIQANSHGQPQYNTIGGSPSNNFGSVLNNNNGNGHQPNNMGGTQANYFGRRKKRSALGVRSNNGNGIQPNNYGGNQNNQFDGIQANSHGQSQYNTIGGRPSNTFGSVQNNNIGNGHQPNNMGGTQSNYFGR
jgi:hypothetical protein